MIKIQNISKTYSIGGAPVHALRGVSLRIEPGEFVAIMGPSGSGKSTLMHILGLLDAPDAGEYNLAGLAVARLPEERLSALRNEFIGFVFQHFNLLARATALENVTLPMLYSAQPVNPPRARQLLEELGLAERIGHRPNELSGGQQQRVAIARALANAPGLMLADEPTGNLDTASAGEILNILEKLNRQGLTVIMVTHEPEVAARARRIIRMRDGLIQSDETAPATPATATAAPRAFSPSGRRRGIIIRELAHHFRQAWRALTAAKMRTLLSMLGILIGVAAVIAMLSIGAGARQSIEGMLSSMGSNLLVLRPGARRVQGVALAGASVTRFTRADAAAIRGETPQARRVSGVVSGRAQVTAGNRNWNTQIVGTEPDYAGIRALQPLIGRFITAEDDQQRARTAVIGLTVMRELFGEANPLGEHIRINKVIFQVVGVLCERGATQWNDQDDLIIIPLSTAMHRLLGREYLDSVDVEIRSAAELDAGRKALDELLTRRHRLRDGGDGQSFTIRDMTEIQDMLTETTRTMEWLLASIAVVSILVGGIGIMNIMLVSVTERTREIGVRKAVGARRRDLLGQFLTEAVVISLGGGLLGILTGVGASRAIAHFAGWAVAVTWQSIMIAFGCAFLSGVVFGIWPAMQASRLNPIDALRYE